MQSGVGDAEALRSFGISVVHHLPGVGANLQDHPDVAIHVTSKVPSVTLGGAMLFPRKQLIGLRWFISRSGPAATNHYEACAFLRSRPGLAEPNIKFELFPAALKPDSFDLYPQAAFQMNIGVMTVASRGKVTLSGPRPSDTPILLVNYLKEPVDRQTHREAVRIARKVLSQPAMAPFTGEELDPGPTIQSDEQIDAWLSKRCASAFHLSGSCRMGPASDASTVVGVDLKVHGIQGLRVADASILPEIVSANTNATSIMIGERAADLIKNA
jgi:choline dehydrogenase